MKDIQILRELAWQYYAISQDEHNAKEIELHKAVNDLHMIRPIVLIDELPWAQMNFNGELTLQCENPAFRGVEDYMRKELFRVKYFRADRVTKPFIPIAKKIKTTGIGITIEENVLENPESNVKSHHYVDQLATEEDIEKLHNPIISIDEEDTNRRYNLIGEAIGDIIPLKKTGRPYFHLSPWDNIAEFRGVTNVLMDLIDDEELSHKMAKKMFDIVMNMNEQYLELGLFDNDPIHLHQTAWETDDLHLGEVKDGKMTFDNVWGRGACQVFSSVSKEMRDEFDIKYMKDTIGRCGLVYYGCCEPLDTMIDIVEKIPHLRKITMTPWANVDVGAEAIGKKYVMSNKPNPASVSLGSLDKEVVGKELDQILNAGKRNGCSFELVLKDISTCANKPQAIFDWEKLAMEKINNF